MESLSFLRTSKIERLLGIITTYSIRDQHISKKLFTVQCIGEICNIPSNHRSKCVSCQMNTRQTHKYGKLPAKLAIITPWKAVCVSLIRPYTLKSKDGTQIDFMCLTMIDRTTSSFEIVELPVSQLSEHDILTSTQGHKGLNTQSSKRKLTLIKHQPQ